jgi:signal transduction histidine kinase
VLKRFTLNNPHKKKLVLCFAFLIIFLIGVIDSQTPTEMPLLGFYLVPIFLVAYYLGFPMGAVVSAASIAAYLIADRIFSIRYIRHEIPYWNSAVWFVFFIIVAYIFANKRKAEESLKQSEAKLRTLAELHEIDRAILSADTSVRVAEEALSGLQNMISFRAGSVLLFPSNHEKAEVLARCGEVTRKPRNLSEFDGLESLSRGQNYHLSANEIQIPLHSHDKLIGVIELKHHEAFNSDQIGISREVADQLAIAIHNTQLFEQLSDADQKLQILLQRLIEVQEAEKRHLARELHDEMGQSLTALKIELEQMESANDPLIQLRSQNGLSIVDSLLEQARSLSAELRPTMLDDLGLIPALRWCVSRQSLVAGFSANFFEDLGDINLPPEVQTTCFRVAQEALTNVARHANASSVSVEITGSSQRLNLLIKDDGRGFDVSNLQRQASPGKCLGLLGMKERVMLIGGDIEVESAPDCGTEVRVYLPIQT